MNPVLIANIISFFGSVLMVLIGLIKTRKNILIAQCASCVLLGTTNAILGGFAGCIANVLSIFRNLIAYKKGTISLAVKIVFTVLQILLTALTNTIGWIGWLPVVSVGMYTWLLNVQDVRKFKLILIITQLMWVIFDFYLKNYVAFTFDILTILSNIIGIVRLTYAKAK